MDFKLTIGIVCTCLILIPFSANSALLTRAGGIAVYDTDLNLTWLVEGNAGFVLMSWDDANTWASNLVVSGTVGGVSDWRLPASANPDSNCTTDTAGSVPHPVAAGYNCIGSEMGHLFYNELGGVAGDSILNSEDPDLLLFPHLQLFQTSTPLFWSSTEYTDPSLAFQFNFKNGGQGAVDKNLGRYVWAVHSGDVFVPVPAAIWLFSTGLLGLIAPAQIFRRY